MISILTKMIMIITMNEAINTMAFATIIGKPPTSEWCVTAQCKAEVPLPLRIWFGFNNQQDVVQKMPPYINNAKSFFCKIIALFQSSYYSSVLGCVVSIVTHPCERAVNIETITCLNECINVNLWFVLQLTLPSSLRLPPRLQNSTVLYYHTF